MAYSGSYRPGREMPSPADREEKKPPQSAADRRGDIPQPPMSIQGILKKIEAAGLETDDLLLALVLFLMYRESGDKDLLILLGAMLLS